MMSSMCSMPTDRRTSSGGRPVSICSSSAQLRVRRRGRVDRERLRVADVRDVREELERVDHLLAGGAAALEADDDQGPPFTFQVRLLEPVHRVARQAGVADPLEIKFGCFSMLSTFMAFVVAEK